MKIVSPSDKGRLQGGCWTPNQPTPAERATPPQEGISRGGQGNVVDLQARKGPRHRRNSLSGDVSEQDKHRVVTGPNEVIEVSSYPSSGHLAGRPTHTFQRVGRSRQEMPLDFRRQGELGVRCNAGALRIRQPLPGSLQVEPEIDGTTEPTCQDEIADPGKFYFGGMENFNERGFGSIGREIQHDTAEEGNQDLTVSLKHVLFNHF